MSAHLQLTGGWAACSEPSVCALPFHLDLLPAQIEVLPQLALYPLLEAFDPPDDEDLHGKYWQDENFDAHRDYDLPAIITSSGSLAWAKNGEYHRAEGKPAIMYDHGGLAWYHFGERHREGDEPAVVNPDGTRMWYSHDCLHRTTGPAIIDASGRADWYINGKLLPERVARRRLGLL